MHARIIGSWVCPRIILPKKRYVPNIKGLRDFDSNWWTVDTWFNPKALLKEHDYSLVFDSTFVFPHGVKLTVKDLLTPIAVHDNEGNIIVCARLGGKTIIESLLGQALPPSGTVAVDVRTLMRLSKYVLFSPSVSEQVRQVGIPSWFGLSLYPYQKEGALTLASGKPFTADEPGLGKSRQTLAAAAMLDPRRLLIISPPVAITSWTKEAGASHIADANRSEHPVLAESVEDIVVPPHVVGVYASRKVKPFPEQGIVVVPDSLLSSRKILLEQVKRWSPDVVIIDEIHRFRNKKASRTATIRQLCKGFAAPVFAASGTPVVADPKELSTQLEMVGRFASVFVSEHDFLKKYFSKTNFGVYVPRQSTLPDMNKVLESKVWIRRYKNDVLSDLPPKVRRSKIVDVKLDEFKVAHQEIVEAIDEWIGKKLPALLSLDKEGQLKDELYAYSRTNALRFISKLRVAAGLCKVGATVECIKEWVELHDDEPLIVWAHHKEVISALCEAAKKEVGADKVSAIMGSTSSQARGQIVSDFQAGKIRVLIASITAAGVGITLTRSHNAIMAETDWTPANIIQAEDRIYRIGQKEVSTITTLIAPGTLDETIQLVLKKKSRILDKTVGGDSNVVTNDEYLDPASVILLSIVEQSYDKAVKNHAKTSRRS